MFTTPEKVTELTGYTVTGDQISQAQAIIESYVGRLEEDITNPSDIGLLERATSFQAAYMVNNWGRTYEQVAVSQMVQNSNMITFKANDKTAPWVAPLAVMACRNLSWTRTRSIKTGRIFGRRVVRWDEV